MQGRKPVPNNIKVLRGSEPRYLNPHEPQAGAEELQFIPEELSEQARLHWGYWRPRLVDAGVANNLDRAALMLMCESMAAEQRFWQDFIRAPVVRGSRNQPVTSPFFELWHKMRKEVMRLQTEFGMTPSSRTRIKSEGRKPVRGGEFDDI